MGQLLSCLFGDFGVDSRKFYKIIAGILWSALKHFVVLNELGDIALAWFDYRQAGHRPWRSSATLLHENCGTNWQAHTWRYRGDLIWILSFYFRIFNLWLCHYRSSKNLLNMIFIAGLRYYWVKNSIYLEFFWQVFINLCVFAGLLWLWVILTESSLFLVYNIITRDRVIYSWLGWFTVILQVTIKILLILV